MTGQAVTPVTLASAPHPWPDMAHTHPDHTCLACRAEENVTRWGYGDENPRDLWPDYVPRNRKAA